MKNVALVAVAVIGALIIGTWWPWWPWGRPYHQWIYVDNLSGEVTLTDMAGTALSKQITVFQNDHMIFVNRTDDDVKLEFDSDDIFGAGNRSFTIEPNQRVIRKVISAPGPEYTVSILLVSTFADPPKLKVGDN